VFSPFGSVWNAGNFTRLQFQIARHFIGAGKRAAERAVPIDTGPSFISAAPIKFSYFCPMITIRLATLNDMPGIMLLLAQVVPAMNAAGNFQWDSTYPNAAVFENDITLNQLWVADAEGEIAGVSAITTDQEAEYASVGWDLNETAIVTHRLAVSLLHRGRGIAAKLLQQAEDEACRRGIKTLRIDTNSNNKATRQLFPKMGYEYAGEIGLAFRPNLRFYCYEKRLDRGAGS
jgi:GNAT superfamily N-acetyltransferase